MGVFIRVAHNVGIVCSCVECGTKLQKGQQLEHDTDLYCKNCHGKKFGTVVHDGAKVGAAKVEHKKAEKKEPKVSGSWLTW